MVLFVRIVDALEIFWNCQWKSILAFTYPSILCPDPSNGILPPDMAVTMDGNDDEGISVIDPLAASQTSAPRSTASGILLSKPIQAVASTAGAASKQSSLSAFFTKSSEKVSFLLP